MNNYINDGGTRNPKRNSDVYYILHKGTNLFYIKEMTHLFLFNIFKTRAPKKRRKPCVCVCDLSRSHGKILLLPIIFGPNEEIGADFGVGHPKMEFPANLSTISANFFAPITKNIICPMRAWVELHV